MAKRKATVDAEHVGSWHQNPERQALNNGHLESLEAASEINGAASGPIQTKIRPRNVRTARIHLTGETELIVHAWSHKAIGEMLTKHVGGQTDKKKKVRAAKVPTDDFMQSLYILEPGKLRESIPGAIEAINAGQLTHLDGDGHPAVHLEGGRYGLPSVAFKNAAVTGWQSEDAEITKSKARLAFHVLGELVEIKGSPRMRMDMVRLKGIDRPADIRFRGGFKEWSCHVDVKFDANLIALDTLVSIFEGAGLRVGVGEWRNEKGGPFGMFNIANPE